MKPETCASSGSGGGTEATTPFVRTALSAARILEIDLRQAVTGHHIVIEMGHDPQGAANDERDDQHAECEGERIIGVVGRRGEVEKSRAAAPAVLARSQS